MSTEERLAIMETKVNTIEDVIAEVNQRLRVIERSVWGGIGILAAINIVIGFIK